MSWRDQGRQYHEWFGHGTSGNGHAPAGGRPDPLFAPGGLDRRIETVAHGAFGHMPRGERHRSMLAFDHERLDQLRTAMRAWIGAHGLDDAAFAARLGPSVGVGAAHALREAATATDRSRSQDDLRHASGRLAAARAGTHRHAQPAAARPAHTPASAIDGPPAPVTADQLRAIMPDAGDQADIFVDWLNRAMVANGIDTPGQRAAFLANVAVESDQLRKMAEDLNYSTAERILKMFPSHFESLDEAKQYLHNPQALANHVYAMLGNNGDESSGDGYRYRGRGLIQITGRDNYRNVGHENDPEALEIPRYAAEASAHYWSDRGLNVKTVEILNREQFARMVKSINRRDPKPQYRWDIYQKAFKILSNNGQKS